MEPVNNVNIDELIKNSVAKATPNMTPEKRKDYEKVLKEVVEDGKSPAQAMGIEKAQLEAFYGIGYNLYNSGKFPEAKNVFSALVRLDGLQARFWYGLAASFHKMKNYERAKDFYMAWAALEVDNPLPYFHASDCCMELNQEREAILFLYMVIEKCGDMKEFDKIKDKAEMTMASLKVKVGWDKKE
jgi:type III secretion system low calcium response chaperone LcrH/SycD